MPQELPKYEPYRFGPCILNLWRRDVRENTPNVQLAFAPSYVCHLTCWRCAANAPNRTRRRSRRYPHVSTSALFDITLRYGAPNSAVASVVYRSTSARSVALLLADTMRDRQPVSRRTFRSECAASSTVIRSARSANNVSRTRGSSIKYSSHVERWRSAAALS